MISANSSANYGRCSDASPVYAAVLTTTTVVSMIAPVKLLPDLIEI